MSVLAHVERCVSLLTSCSHQFTQRCWLQEAEANSASMKGGTAPPSSQQSVYYHPTLNPQGIPPPGKAARCALRQATVMPAKRGLNHHRLAGFVCRYNEEALPSSAASIPLPQQPLPPPRVPAPGLHASFGRPLGYADVRHAATGPGPPAIPRPIPPALTEAYVSGAAAPSSQPSLQPSSSQGHPSSGRPGEHTAASISEPDWRALPSSHS